MEGMRTSALSALAVLACGACGAPPPPALAPPPRAPAPSASAASTAAVEPPAPELTPPRAAPVCTYASELWRGEPVALRAGPDAEPFGDVAAARSAKAHVLATGGWLEVDTGQAKLRGYFDVSAPFLHPARPLLVDGVLVAGGAARLSVEGARGDKLLVRVAPPVDAELLGTATVAAACDALSLDPARFALDALLPEDRPLARASLAAGRDVLLSREPGGPAALRVHLAGPGGEEVAVLARRPGLARIVWRRAEGAIFGWVAARELTPPPPAGGVLTLAEVDDGVAREPPPKTARRRATRAAPLVIERAGARVTVGSVTEGAVLGAVLPVGPGPTRIDAAPLGLSLRLGARAYLPGGALGDAPAPVADHDGAPGRAILALAKQCREGRPAPPGTAVVRVAVDAEGRVDAVKVSADPSLGDLPACLAAKLRAARLAGPRGATVEASLSFTP